MKCVCFLVFASAFAMVSCSPALPFEEQSDLGSAYAEVPLEESGGLRFKRATCDGGSFSSKWFTPNHSLCAAHCLVKGYKGGSCKNTICHCRDKF